MTDRVRERRRAAQLARYYRDQENLTIAEIARRLGRAEGTVKAYLYDPIGDKARGVKARYRGVCRGCGAPTSARNGKGDAYAYCKRCRPGAIARQWTRERSREAMRAWRARYGAAPSSYDWSRTHARRRAAKRSNDYRPEDGPRRRLWSTCTGAGRRPSPTPSAAPERLGVTAVDIRMRACARRSVNRTAARRPPARYGYRCDDEAATHDSDNARPRYAYSGSADVYAVVTALMLAATQASVSAGSIGRTDSSAMGGVRACGPSLAISAHRPLAAQEWGPGSLESHAMIDGHMCSYDE
jgi:hypothetical protein